MSIDLNKPVKTDHYDTGLLSSIRAHVVSLACWLDPSDAGTVTNPVAGIRRWVAGSVPERWSGSAWVEMVTGFQKFTAPVTYGSTAFAGSTGSYYGIQFSSSTKKWTFMVDAAGLSGLYSVTDAAWKWYWDSSGVLNVGTVPWARLSNVPISNGVYTPTFTNSSGCSSMTATEAFLWTQVGDVVTVTGQVTVNRNTTGTPADFYFTLPVAVSAPPAAVILSGAGTAWRNGGGTAAYPLFIQLGSTGSAYVANVLMDTPISIQVLLKISFSYRVV